MIIYVILSFKRITINMLIRIHTYYVAYTDGLAADYSRVAVPWSCQSWVYVTGMIFKLFISRFCLAIEPSEIDWYGV